MDGKTGAGGATEGGEAPDTITVKVLAMNQPGAPLVLRCRLDDRVAQLHRLAAAQHTPPLGPHEYLKLLYCGRMLRDARTLREEALEVGCTVLAILSQHPPSNATSGGSSTRSTRNNNSRSNNPLIDEYTLAACETNQHLRPHSRCRLRPDSTQGAP